MRTSRKTTGHFDCNLALIYEGDHVTIPEHSNECCQHMLRCVVEWDVEHGQWMLKFEGRIIAPLTFAGGFYVEEAYGRENNRSK